MKITSLTKDTMVKHKNYRAEDFQYSFYYNEGLKNKVNRTPFLGLVKSIFYVYNETKGAKKRTCASPDTKN